MVKKYAILTASMLFSQIIFAQFHFSVGMNLGGSQLFHNTNFKASNLQNDYLVTKQRIWNTYQLEYTWEQYEEGNKLRYDYFQPRMGFSASLRFREWPLMIIAEAMSSPSTYEKMAYGATIALGKNFDLGDSDYFLTAFGGYKFVKDMGFGNKTLVNSIGDKTIRENMATYFAPEKPLGPQTGRLFSLRVGVGKTFGVDDQITAGIEALGELDMTDKIKRQSRMTNIAFQAYARFDFEFRLRRRLEVYPDPAGGRRN
ncbi:MAG: hypothetical protein ACKVT2_18800 [Saprospiraceae bacterium]